MLELVSLVTPVNVASIVKSLPDGWLADIRADIDSAPTTDWSTFRIVIGGTFSMTAEQYNAWIDKQVAAYRTGVESLRTFLVGDDFR